MKVSLWHEGLADDVVIRNNKGNAIYSNHQSNVMWESEPQSSQELEETRNRVWTLEELANYQEDWQNVYRSMYARGASQNEIEAMKRQPSKTIC